VISIPSNVDGAVRVSGAATLDSVVRAPDGSRTAYVRTTAGNANAQDHVAGVYRVTVGDVPGSVLATVTAEAANPPSPITEPAARTMALDALNALLQSPDPQIRSKAVLIEGLSAIVLGSTDPNGSAP
jgi:hypothetical protein